MCAGVARKKMKPLTAVPDISPVTPRPLYIDEEASMEFNAVQQ